LSGASISSHLPLLHPARRPYRFTVLLFASAIIFGSYFAYDSVAAIEQTLMEHLDIGQQELGRMYAMYSYGAILTLFFSGVLIDRIGTRRSSLLFSGLVTLGAVIVATAPNVWVLFGGRFLFGAGSEALIVAQNAILARWFRGKELAFAFGVALTISRIGTLFTFNTEALIARRMGPMYALWVAAALCGVSILANLVYVSLDRYAEPRLGLREERAGDRIRLAEVARLPPTFWLVTALCVTFYSAIFPFTGLAPNFFREKWGLPSAIPETGSFLKDVLGNFLHMFSTAPGTASIVIFASMCFAPFAGMLVDRVGRRATLMVLGSALMIAAHAAMGFTELPPRWPMIVLGAGFVLVPAAMWPSVALIVERNRVGTAYGLMTLIQNLGLAAFPEANGWLRETTGSYTASQTMFTLLGVSGLVFAVLLRAADRRHGDILEKPERATA
jgi:MFS family permease